MRRKVAADKKRRAVAAGIVAGKRKAEIAELAECSARQVERLANEPETQAVIAEMMKPHINRLHRLIEKSIDTVEVALDAERSDKADHMARLRAVGRAKDLLLLAQGEKPPEVQRQVTWPEFLLLIAQQEKPHAT